MSKEDLTTREAAKALNLNPCYLSMARYPKSWNSMSKDAWYRLTQWHNSRGKITEFKLPDDEAIWKPQEKLQKEQSRPETKEVDTMDSPFPEKKIKSPKQSKPVPEFPADRIESHKDPDKKPEVQDSGNTKKKPEKNRTEAQNIFPGIRSQLVKELQTRLTEIDTERAGIEKLLEQYVV
jgi:hypothetical protein